MKKNRIILLLLAGTILFSLFSVGADAADGEPEETPRVNIYFINVSAYNLSGDCILIESDGHWGLIDAGHRLQTTIADSDGTVYRCSFQQQLSCQYAGKYGESVANWIASALHVTHLDFVLATHSHSDHIGGIPAVARFSYYSPDLQQHHLVDESTVYFYKPYHHINEYEDDLGGEAAEAEKDEAAAEEAEQITLILSQDRETEIISSWHNQAFYYQALSAMEEQGSVTADLSGGAEPGGRGSAQKYAALTKRINERSALSECVYDEGEAEDLYDDCLSFRMGEAEIRLYNLLPRETDKNENINSVVAALSDGTSTAVLLADINVDQHTEQQIAAAIRDDLGTADLIKAAHHGARFYSNSKGMLDALQPALCVVTSAQSPRAAAAPGAFTCARYYASAQYGTAFYETGAAGRGMLAQLGKGGVSLFALPESGNAVILKDPDYCLYTGLAKDGWTIWQNEYPESYRPAAGEWMYFLEGKPLTGWVEEDERRYYFGEDGLLLNGAQEIDGKKYYLWTDDHYGMNYGSKLTGWLDLAEGRFYFLEDGTEALGWQEIDGRRYYFGEDGAACVGWTQLDGAWYFFSRDGAMLTGWYEEPGPGRQRRYYLGEDGVMLTGWQEVDGRRLCFGEDGALLTGLCEFEGARYGFDAEGNPLSGWQEIDGKRRRFDEDGRLITGWQLFDGAWHYFDADGVMLTGWHRLERDGRERLCRFDEDGALRLSLG